MKKAFVLAVAVWTAVASGATFKGGLWKEFVYEMPDMMPIVFGGESRSVKAVPGEYCIYLDIWYADDTPVWGRCAHWTPGTHDWEKTRGVFIPKKPVKKIQMFAFLRRGSGTAEFRNLALERREGTGEVCSVRRTTRRPFANVERIERDVFIGREIKHEVREEALPVPLPVPESVPTNGAVVWLADSMRKVTPLTFPTANEVAAPKRIALALARRESESFQVEVSCGGGAVWERGNVALPVLKNAKGEALKGEFKWERVGYLAREAGYAPHPCGIDSYETWLPDPLLPAAPFRVRAASTQGLWFTVHAAPDATPGVYIGDVAITEQGALQATVRVAVRVEPFTLPATFGMATAFCVMDGFLRAQYGEARWREMKRRSWDVMLDHRLNPDDISRTTPPEIPDLLHARARGMNRFNILNIVPPPKDPKTTWVCFTPPEATFNPSFYPAFKARLAPYVAELRKYDLMKYAYVYGFDERQHEYYAGIDRLWKQLKADFPDLPVMTTAMMYRDKAAGRKYDFLETTDWFCPLTSVYRPDLSAALRAKGKQVWWYTCCGPRWPYANMSSLEYPPIEGRLLGWMGHLYRADGLLFWHVNYWNRKPFLDERDTYFPAWHTGNSLHMPGDGIFLYPSNEHILPSIRLAQVRDGVEDYECLQLAAAKAGADATDAVSRSLITSMTNYTRDPARLRAARARLAVLYGE